ncbi:c-type cytochrome domain-containing protein [Motiliproteus sp. MSK22-1]|uniref:c-type cytochrome domain-containing protein n=1 Tax=Motiliproteus sp. MSK22-1 TaxID=1897630 RepID=UPI00097711CF|nr:c-type cytochrome domain-containing protein [Motiliproteus sp. MSK22-1]OMH38131.1 hypothetical protein BGP75_07625 [Motiliproteus sp. MSK22-1]
MRLWLSKLYCLLIGSTLQFFFSQFSVAEVSYDKQIKPILDEYCVECHSGWFPDGGLRLDTRENILEGGKQGAAVIPGKPGKGWLINLIKTEPGRYSKMPPGKEQLDTEQINMIKNWIAEGAR